MDVIVISASPSKDGLGGRPVVSVAAGGCSGNGMITCLASKERRIQHARARLYTLLPVNRWSRGHKLVAIRAAARTMVEQEMGSDQGSRGAAAKGTRCRGKT